ncbi:MAG: hypothetical protein JW797_08410 [Bradymonadales bacterium]|nr:hypothetical protein [Bradymonadales bacterium]
MVGPRHQLVKRKATQKGALALGVGVTTVALSLLLTPWLWIPGLVATGYFTYDWLRYRGTWGLRF